MSYTIQDLLNKHVVIGTPESTVFLGECERLGVKCGRFGDDSPTKFAKDKEAVKFVYLKCLDVYTLTQSSVSYLKSINSEPFKLKEVARDIDESIQLSAKLEAITAERDQLASELEEVKALFVDAIGDGWYDGYLACKNDVNNESFDIDTVKDSDVLQWSEHYESEHRYSKSIADIRAKAVMNFAEVNRGAYQSGFVSPELTVYDVYQFARNHVKDNYGYETKTWTGEDADKAKAATCETIALALESINPVEFVAMALRHTTVSSDFDYQDIKDAFKLLADEYRQAAKDGAA